MTDLPIACTLPLAALSERNSLIRDLAHGALLRARRSGLTLHLTYDRSAAARVRELVQKERSCCAFLRFEVAEDAAGVQLSITAPERARDAVEFIFAPFTAEAETTAVDTDTTEKEPT